MDHYTIGCDAHKHFSVFSVRDGQGQVCERCRVPHQRGAITAYLSRFPPDTPVALETIGNWYWLVDEIEEAGCRPLLAHAGKAKVMMGHINKTDKLDADGLSLLLHLGTLPQVWVPPGELRDERELPRTRMVLVRLRTTLKNRVHATLAKYGLTVEEATDLFAGRGRQALSGLLPHLPSETQRCLEQEFGLIDRWSEEVHRLEKRIRERIRLSRLG